MLDRSLRPLPSENLPPHGDIVICDDFYMELKDDKARKKRQEILEWWENLARASRNRHGSDSAL